MIRYKIFDQKNKKEDIFINDKIRGEISIDRKLLDDKIILKMMECQHTTLQML